MKVRRRLARWRRWFHRQGCRWHGHDFARRYEPGWREVDVCGRCGHMVPVPNPNCRCVLTPIP